MLLNINCRCHFRHGHKPVILRLPHISGPWEGFLHSAEGTHKGLAQGACLNFIYCRLTLTSDHWSEYWEKSNQRAHSHKQLFPSSPPTTRAISTQPFPACPVGSAAGHSAVAAASPMALPFLLLFHCLSASLYPCLWFLSWWLPPAWGRGWLPPTGHPIQSRQNPVHHQASARAQLPGHKVLHISQLQIVTAQLLLLLLVLLLILKRKPQPTFAPTSPGKSICWSNVR